LIPLFLNCDSQIADFLSGPSQKFIMSRAPAPLKSAGFSCYQNRRIAATHWFDKTIVFPNSRLAVFFAQKPPFSRSKYSFRKTMFNLFEPDE
jgi:hypothetical protein